MIRSPEALRINPGDIHYSFLVGAFGSRPPCLPANSSGGAGHKQFQLWQTPH